MTDSGRTGQWFKAGLVALVVLAVDQSTKVVVRADVLPGERLHPLPLVGIVNVRNTGIAFGALGGAGWLVPVLTLVALCGVFLWFALKPTRPYAWIPAGLIVGGAIGNLADRAQRGAVTDFIALPHWPAFNFADCAITVGVILLLIVSERDGSKTKD